VCASEPRGGRVFRGAPSQRPSCDMLRSTGAPVHLHAPGPALMPPLLLLALAAGDARADDDICPSTVASLEAELATTLAAWNAKDRDGYLINRDRVFARLACVDARLPESVAADIHAVRALDAFAARRPDVATAALRARADLDAGGPLEARIEVIPPQLAELRAQAAALPESPSEPLPEGPTFWIDGQEASTWQPARVGVIQAPSTTDDGRIWTDQIPLGGPLPTAPAWTHENPPAELGGPRRPGRGWWWASGVTAATSGGLWWWALSEKSTFDGYLEEPQPLDPSRRPDVERTLNRTNRLGTAAQVASGLTVGLTTVAVVVSF